MASHKSLGWSSLELLNVIGSGQAGVVWRAKLKHAYQDLPLHSLVAVKVYKQWVLEEPGQFERIVRELELGRRVEHPNVVRTISIVADPSGRPALVMPYYEGESLAQ